MSEESRPKKQSVTQIIEVKCRIQLAKPQVRTNCEKDNKLEKMSDNTSIYLTPPSKFKPVPNSHKSGSDANNTNAPFESLVPLTALQQVTTVVCMLFYRRENATNRQKQLPIEANANRTLREVIREAFIKSRVPILPDTFGRVYKSERGFGKGHELSPEMATSKLNQLMISDQSRVYLMIDTIDARMQHGVDHAKWSFYNL